MCKTPIHTMDRAQFCPPPPPGYNLDPFHCKEFLVKPGALPFEAGGRNNHKTNFLSRKVCKLKKIRFFILEQAPHERALDINDVKNTISQLYSQLNVEQHQIEKEQELLAKLEELKVQIQPMDKVIHEDDWLTLLGADH